MPSDEILALVNGLRHPSRDVRYDCACRLSYFGDEARLAVPSLIKTVEDDDEWVSSWSADALGRVRPVAVEAIPVLIKCLGAENERVCCASREALFRMGLVAVPSLLNALKGGNDQTRELSGSALSWITPISEESMSALINALGDDCERVRNAIANALGNVGRPALPSLVNALSHENEWVRAKSAYALGRMGTQATEAVPALISARRDKSRRVRSKSARALNRIKACEEEKQEDIRRRTDESSGTKVKSVHAGPRMEGSWLPRVIIHVRDAIRVLAGVRPAEIAFDELDQRIGESCAVVAADKITALLAPDTDDLDAYDDVHRNVTRWVFEAIKEYASHEARHGTICRESLRRERACQNRREEQGQPDIPF